MAAQTQAVRIPKDLYATALETADKYGVTIGEALRMMSQGDATEKPSDDTLHPGYTTQSQPRDDMPLQPSTTEESQASPSGAADLSQGGATQSQASDPETSGAATPAALVAAPVAGEIVVRHHHLIEDARDPERLDRLEQQAEEQQEINAHFAAGIMANNAMQKDHLGQHAEGRRKFDTDQSLEAGNAAYRDTYAAVMGMKNRRARENVLRRLKRLSPPDAEDTEEPDEPDYDAAA